jgi:hypothetical protein
MGMRNNAQLELKRYIPGIASGWSSPSLAWKDDKYVMCGHNSGDHFTLESVSLKISVHHPPRELCSIEVTRSQHTHPLRTLATEQASFAA